MTDAVAVCNQAMDLIGSSANITAIAPSDGSKNANWCARNYDQTRRERLRAHRWGFAVKLVKLGQNTTDPVHGFDYLYNRPALDLRILGVWDNDAMAGTVEYQVQGLAIAASANELWLSYVEDKTDPDDWDVLFLGVLAHTLAIKAAIPLGNLSNVRLAEVRAERKRLLSEARTTDALEDWPAQMPESTWISERS